ncbi:MAG TPA: hypothetical protein EYP98_04040 [Planctomycetes bacterium]|nr:hypothetical protein [Planctomycetota bacterium]
MDQPFTGWTPEEARNAKACLDRDHATNSMVAVGERFALALLEKGPKDLAAALDQADAQDADANVDLLQLLDDTATALRARLQNVEAVQARILVLAAEADVDGGQHE